MPNRAYGERIKTILMKIKPNLGEMANKEASKDAKGLLFGEGLAKSLGKYIANFTGQYTAKTSIRKVFGGVFEGPADGDLILAEDYKGLSTIKPSEVLEEASRGQQLSSHKEASRGDPGISVEEVKRL
ncbi:hypothetical protein NDU88_006528 [Pleurodeles waltl]|uniref:Uncharacterized protein n=1 Tax=Pleurodeles waltl TaxID=8319 RepID=A0AAV7PMP4_PLEWA|nr:hypothetical protein NDU88_006528 [Pleurodeles waltl]